MFEYIIKVLLLAMLGYWVYWYLIGRNKISKAEKIRAEYKQILDSKLPALGFELKYPADGGRDNIISYRKDNLEVRLHHEPILNYNRVEALSGKLIPFQEHIKQFPPVIQNKMSSAPGFNGSQLVAGTDFYLDLTDSQEAKKEFTEKIDQWLAENL